MLRTFLAYLVFCTVFFSSCNFIPAKKKLLVYTQITATNDTLDLLTREWHQLLYLSTKDKNFSRLKPIKMEMARFLSRNRSVIANLEISPDSQNLIDSEGVFLSTQATMVSEIYTPFESYNEMTPNQEINRQLILVANDLNNEVAGKAAINRSLQAYLRKNKLKAGK